jgi:hypothetical protein
MGPRAANPSKKRVSASAMKEAPAPSAGCQGAGTLRAGPGEGGNPHARQAKQKTGHRLCRFAAQATFLGQPSSREPRLAAQGFGAGTLAGLADRGLPTKQILAAERLQLAHRGENYGSRTPRAHRGKIENYKSAIAWRRNGPLFFHQLSIIRAAVFQSIPL